MTYDENNIFAKILRGDIPNNTVYEDEYVLAFSDVNPLAEVHVLVIPKGTYTDISDFSANANKEEQLGFMVAIDIIVEKLNLKEKGFRTIMNIGEHGCQTVSHMHMHILGGEQLGSLIVG